MIHDSERINWRRRSSRRMFQVERSMIHNSWFKLWKKDVLWNIFGQSSEIHDSWFTLWNERRELIQDVDLVTYLSDSWFRIQRVKIGGEKIPYWSFKYNSFWFMIHDSRPDKRIVWKCLRQQHFDWARQISILTEQVNSAFCCFFVFGFCRVVFSVLSFWDVQICMIHKFMIRTQKKRDSPFF